jgi:uncharacterized protein
MKYLIAAAVCAGAALAHAQTTSTAPAAVASSPAKKELVQKLLIAQQPGLENISRGLVERPVAQMAQEVRMALQQMPPEKREVAAKAIDADVKKYMDEAVPIVRDRAIKLAPSTIGAAMEEKFSEDELKQLLAWIESPLNKKYSQFGPEVQGTFTQRLLTESAPAVDPKMQTLFSRVRSNLGLPPASAAASAPAAKSATPAKKAASK